MADVPEALRSAEAALLAPGAPFELEEVAYLGETVLAPKHRAPHLRAVVERAATFGDRPYAIFADRDREFAITYAEFGPRVAAIATHLASAYGVGPSDRVAILGENRLEWLLTFFATVSLGAVAVGLNGWWTGPELLFALEDSAPRVLVADAKRLARLEGSRHGVPVWSMEEGVAQLAPSPGVSLPTTPIAHDDAALILYTSGTTGRPKGAVHTHFNVTCMIMTSFFHGARMSRALGLVSTSPPVTLVTSPLFHVSGLHAAAITSLAGGATTVWPMGKFDPELVLTLIERHRVSGWGYTATMLHRLLAFDGVARFDTSSLRLVGGGGSPIPARLQQGARALLPTVRDSLGVGYGLTESSAFTCLIGGEELATHPESSGRPLPGVQVEIRDQDGRVLPEGIDGDIHVRGPLVMKEYWRNEDATRATLLPGRWLRTGDVGCLREGRIYLASRKRDLILRGGENVYPAEIEQRLEEHDAVAEAAVLGVEHDELGQAVHAVVVVAPGAQVSAGQLAAFCAERLAYFKVPAHFEFRSEPLPRNATGKVLKHQLASREPAQFIEE